MRVDTINSGTFKAVYRNLCCEAKDPLNDHKVTMDEIEAILKKPSEILGGESPVTYYKKLHYDFLLEGDLGIRYKQNSDSGEKQIFTTVVMRMINDSDAKLRPPSFRFGGPIVGVYASCLEKHEEPAVGICNFLRLEKAKRIYKKPDESIISDIDNAFIRYNNPANRIVRKIKCIYRDLSLKFILYR